MGDNSVDAALIPIGGCNIAAARSSVKPSAEIGGCDGSVGSTVCSCGSLGTVVLIGTSSGGWLLSFSGWGRTSRKCVWLLISWSLPGWADRIVGWSDG